MTRPTSPAAGGATGGDLLGPGETWSGHLQTWVPALVEAASAVSDAGLELEAELVQLASELPRRRSTAAAAPGSALQAIHDLRASKAHGPPGVLAYLDLLGADVYRRAGEPMLAQLVLRRAASLYESADDDAGRGACDLMTGDWAAAPCSSPLIWNGVLMDGPVEYAYAWLFPPGGPDRAGVDAAAAARAYEGAARLFERAQAPRGLAAVELRRSYLAVLRGDAAAGAAAADRAARMFDAAGDRLGNCVARVHRELCVVGHGGVPDDAVADVGDRGRTEGSYSVALGLGLLFSRVGRRWVIVGELERGLTCLRLARAVFRALGAAEAEATSANDAATVHILAGSLAAAQHHYEEAWVLRESVIRARPARAAVLRYLVLETATDLALAHERRGDADRLEQTMARLDRLLDRSADAAAASGEPAFVQAVAEDAARLRRHAAVQSAVLRLAAAREAGDQGEVDAALGRAFAVVAGLEPEERAEQEAYLWLVVGRPGPAPQAPASAHARPPSFAAPPVQLSYHYRAATYLAEIGDFAGAKPHLDSLLALMAVQPAGPVEQWQVALVAGRIAEGLAQPAAALAAYERGAEAMEQRRALVTADALKVGMSGAVEPQLLYAHGTRLALALRGSALQAGERDAANGYAARAFALAERGRARGMLDLMSRRARERGTSATATDLLGAWRQASARLALWQGVLAHQLGGGGAESERAARARREVAAAEAGLDDVSQRLAAADPELYRLLNPQAAVIALDACAARLVDDGLLIQYHVQAGRLLRWALTREGMVHADAVPVAPTDLRRQVGVLHAACATPGTPVPDLGPLAATLLGGLEELIESAQRIVVVPHGPLHLVPFHALPWRGEPLVEGRAVSYLPSASAIALIGRSGVPERLLAVGNPAGMAHRPTFDAPPVKQRELVHARTEALYVASRFAGARALVGAEATEEAVRAGLTDRGCLHFATHTLLSAEAPLLSAILLADGGELTVDELMGLRLEADLVVLSSCESGRGEVTGGDDVLGLGRGMLAAGARGLVTSLWPVDDLSTSILMGMFYDRLRDGQPTDRALQYAQNRLRRLTYAEFKVERDRLRETVGALGHAEPPPAARGGGQPTGASIAQYGHPRYWAAFTVTATPAA